ncbi:hypothetical protein UlMin_045539 [Ulmus minor]
MYFLFSRCMLRHPDDPAFSNNYMFSDCYFSCWLGYGFIKWKTHFYHTTHICSSFFVIDKLYEGLDKFLRLKLLQQPKSLRFVATKVAMDGIIFGPLDLFLNEDVKRDFLPALVLEGGVWPIVQVVNFRYVPVRYQFLYVNIFCLMDSAFMSWVEQLKDAAWEQWFTSFSLKERGGQGRL